MQTGELLAELRHHVLRDISDQVAGASDYLWSDTGLIRYINEGQNRFARQTKCIRDASTPAICQFTTVDSQEFYTLDPHVLSVLSVRMTGDKADMARAGHSDLDTYRQPDTYFFDPSQLSSMPPGKPVAWTTDEGVIQDTGGSYTAVQLRLYPVPLTPYVGIVGNMRVARLPLVPLSISAPDGVPEIPEEHHMDILNWAAYLALRGVDLDVAGGGAWDRAKEFRAAFDDAVSDMKKDAQSKMFRPLQWGFGRDGWSYERY
jgi:hypothetical protein